MLGRSLSTRLADWFDRWGAILPILVAGLLIGGRRFTGRSPAQAAVAPWS